MGVSLSFFTLDIFGKFIMGKSELYAILIIYKYCNNRKLKFNILISICNLYFILIGS